MNTVLLLIILIPSIEIFLFIKIGSEIGAITTILLIFTTAIVGIYYAKYEGINTLRSGFAQISKNKAPTYEMISGAAIAFAALLLIIPGFATDILGFLIIFPVTRNFFLEKFFFKFKKQENEIKEKALDVLKFLKIDHLINEKAGNLSGGQKKLLELARTMMVDAKIVFLDEVGAGVNKSLLKEISDSILKLNEERKYTFCIIEHDIDFITKLCDPVIVLAEGKVLFQGTAEEVKDNNEVIDSYLGKSN